MAKVIRHTENMKDSFDLTVINSSENRNDSENLIKELNLSGVRTNSLTIKVISEICNNTSIFINKSSATILLVNSALLNSIKSEEINLSKLDKKIIIIFFCTQKTNRNKVIIESINSYIAKSRNINSLSSEIIRDIFADKSRKILFKPDKSRSRVWYSPLYIFKKIKEYDTEVKLLLDVTWSSKPTKPQLAPTLKSALRETFKFIGKSSCKIIDFGAGKLRYSVFLLQKGHSVTAVDFESIYVRPTEQIKGYINQASKHKNFNQIVYPSEFIEHDDKYDLALLINVLGVMPEPIERLFVLTQCNKILGKGDYLLLFNQHGDKDQIEAASDRITDGGCTTSKGKKTFYKDFNTQEELILLFSLAGFERVNDVEFDPSSSHILLFKKKEEAHLNINDLIETKRPIIGREIFIGETSSEIALADIIDSDKCLKFGGMLLFFLNDTKKGKSDAYKYEKIIKLIIRYIFDLNFKTHIIDEQYEIDEGRKRIDLKANWRNNSELKKTIIENYGLRSSCVPIECKNYSIALKNPEYSQIIDRCSKRHRHFGIIFCRDAKDRRNVTRHCHDRWINHEYLIIVIDDDDLEKLLSYRDKDKQDNIIEFFERRISEVIDNIIN